MEDRCISVHIELIEIKSGFSVVPLRGERLLSKFALAFAVGFVRAERLSISHSPLISPILSFLVIQNRLLEQWCGTCASFLVGGGRAAQIAFAFVCNAAQRVLFILLRLNLQAKVNSSKLR